MLSLIEFKGKSKIYIFYAQTKKQRREYSLMVQNSYATFKSSQMQFGQTQPQMQRLTEVPRP